MTLQIKASTHATDKHCIVSYRIDDLFYNDDAAEFGGPFTVHFETGEQVPFEQLTFSQLQAATDDITSHFASLDVDEKRELLRELEIEECSNYTDRAVDEQRIAAAFD